MINTDQEEIEIEKMVQHLMIRIKRLADTEDGASEHLLKIYYFLKEQIELWIEDHD